MIIFLANGLVIAGTCILILALFPLRELIGKLSPGRIVTKWYVLTALTLLFIIGYSVYMLAFWNRHTVLADLLVPSIFFFGASFVRLIVGLSLKTIVDVRRMTVLELECITDPLTGIYNRRYLDRRLKEEVGRAQRYGLPLSVALIDIDFFKSINDTYGHQGGDIVLTSLGKLIPQNIRPSDIAARYGGEEFCIIFAATPALGAKVLAERLHQHIASQKFVLIGRANERPELQVTVSIGLASLDQEINNEEMLIQRADEALYRAKREGRNRVIAAQQGAASDAPQAARTWDWSLNRGRERRSPSPPSEPIHRT